MRKKVVSAVQKLSRSLGIDVVRYSPNLRLIVPEATDAELKMIERSKPLSMTSVEKLWAVIESVRYIVARKLLGDFVECGVWRGGSSMAAALALMAQGDTQRHIWLFDTFEGMPRPSAMDLRLKDGRAAIDQWLGVKRSDTASTWCEASIEEVRENMASTGYPVDHISYVRGKVEDTLVDPKNLPDSIAFLRLDTDWYESTKIELEVLFDRLVPGGILVIDDYGHWAGARRAVDEFLASRPDKYLLQRIDYSGRLLIKV